MNIYRGCSHGCIYCDSRSLCYKIEDFDHIRIKKDALQVIQNDLRRKRKKGVIATGSMSDPYNPLEKEYKLTGNALELLHTYRFGAAIATKSDLIVRDINILKELQVHSPVLVKITITTSDDNLCRLIEPNAPLSSERFSAIKSLSDNGIYTGVLMMPLLPFIEDTEENILTIVHKAKENGARFIYPALGMTLRSGNREYYYEKLDKYFPGTKEKYTTTYGERYYNKVPHAKNLWTIFTGACNRMKLLYKMEDIIIDYKQGYAVKQLPLF